MYIYITVLFYHLKTNKLLYIAPTFVADAMELAL